ncbi:fungal specific transcription factor domain-containing protein [Aspergillus affinis]|uniref:fungal specific transcription factor domain-containing protein n=1 Tax=Aspergillus affinis TaxID=1070780 RepID=UPI0022FDC6DB|nr:uncharacterized protein KD926_010162 [Aspergillus affinis]KAI9038829.1 hypothetical protein KD926_010162 [Aspergillus affinis]
MLVSIHLPFGVHDEFPASEWEARLLRALSEGQTHATDDGTPVSNAAPARATYTPATTTSPSSEGINSQTEEPFCTSATDKALPTGYLGPTSFVATFEDDREFVSSPSDVLRQDGAERLAALPGLSPYWVHKAGEVLNCLKDFTTISQLVEEYYNISQAAVIPAPLVMNPLIRVKAAVEEWQVHGYQTSDQATTILANTAQPFQIPPMVEANEFYELFTGSRLRLEIVGVIYAIAGRTSMFSLARDRLPSTNWLVVREKFARRMMVASDIILQICRILTPVNDLTIWLMYENLLLSSVVHGDSSSGKWHRLGDLSSHMFELGIHRDPQQLSDLPVFILESRRRIFAAAYQLDKSVATFLGRPPRISWRHSDCSLPLDLADDSLVGGPSEFELASTSIDSKGWNVQNVIQRASWIRVRFLISTFREEILELSLQGPTREMADQLRDISFRCHQAWNSLPSHLQYNPNCWDSVFSIDICLMLSVCYLAYLYNDFLIQRLLVQQDPEAQTSLLDVSSTILSTVLSFGIQREHVIDIQRDFIWTVLLYGFPSAGVLTKALQNQARTGLPIPYSGSRSRLIRDLSVFISHLETMARPGIANHELFARASRVMSSIIDDILEAREIVPSNAPDPETMPSVLDGFDISDDLKVLDSVDFGAVFDQWIF